MTAYGFSPARNKTSSEPLLCRTLEARKSPLADLSTRLQMLKSQLLALSSMTLKLSEDWRVNGPLAASCECRSDAILEEMQSISLQTSRVAACNMSELSAKAEIWLERHIPDDGDDVTMLAASICRDIIAMDRAGSADRDQEADHS